MTSTPFVHAGSGLEILELAAFADGPGGGNPAGVVLDASQLTDDEMQAIATGLGHPETAFVVESAPRRVRLRYFSPGAEVPFCGHATIATAVVLAERRGPGAFTVDTAVGELDVETERDGGGTITASFTSVRPSVRDLDPSIADELLGLLGLSRDDLDQSLPLREAFAGNWHPVVAVRELDVFDGFGFDPEALRILMSARGWSGTVTVVHATRPVGSPVVDVEARNLFPVGTISEDPATGSAAAALGGYLREIGAVAPPARFVVHQGRHVGRPSILLVDVPETGGITVTGTAIPLT